MNFAKRFLQAEKEREAAMIKYAKKELRRQKEWEKQQKEKEAKVRTKEEEYTIECVDSLLE